jgi:hypothetical protein
MEPRIQYVRSADGTNIAYTVIGEGVPMIFSPRPRGHVLGRLCFRRPQVLRT